MAGLALGVLVGFGEEIATRGLLLAGLRGRLGEVGVWIVTCVLFGLVYGANIFLGAAALGRLLQIVNQA